LTVRPVVVAALIGLAALAGAGPAGAGPTGEDEPTALAVIDQTLWVPPDGVFTLSASPRGAAVDPEGSIRIRLRDPVANRNEFTIGLGEAGPGPVDAELTVPTSLALRPDGSVGLVLPTDPTGPIPIDQPGVYPIDLTVDLLGGGTSDLLSHLVRLPTEDERPALRVAVVVPVGVGPLVGPDGSLSGVPAAAEQVEQRVAPLLATPEVPVSVTPLPETVASLASTAAGQPAVDQLTAALQDGQVLGSPYVDLDEADWVDSGLRVALGQQFAAGQDAIDATAGLRADRTTRHLTEPPTESTLPVLQAEGTTRLVVPSATIPPEGRPTDGPWLGPVLLTAPDAQIAAAVTDPDLQAHAGSTGDPVLDAIRTLADLATIALDRPIAPAGLPLAVPALGGPVDTYLATLLDGLDGGPLEPVTVADWFDQVDPTPAADAGGAPGETLARPVAPRETGGLTGYRDALALTELTIGGLTALTDDTDPTLEDLRRQALVSGSRQLTDPERFAYLSAVGSTIRERTQLIDTPADQAVTLTSRSGSIPVTLRNLMGNPATVRLLLRSDRLEFPEGSQIEVALDDELTTVAVPVRARTTGSFQMEVAVTSPDGILAITATSVTIRSTAVSGVGLVLSIGAGLVLFTWWVRHWRERRRDARLIPVPEGSGTD
jgi:hypothetical protein